MWTAIGIVAALCAGFVLGTLYGRKLMKKALAECIDLSNDAEDALNRLKSKIGL